MAVQLSSKLWSQDKKQLCKDVPDLEKEMRENSLEGGETPDGKEVGFLKLTLKGEILYLFIAVENTEIPKGVDSISWSEGCICLFCLTPCTLLTQNITVLFCEWMLLSLV